jgi:hypothetical protein
VGYPQVRRYWLRRRSVPSSPLYRVYGNGDVQECDVSFQEAEWKAEELELVYDMTHVFIEAQLDSNQIYDSDGNILRGSYRDR